MPAEDFALKKPLFGRRRVVAGLVSPNADMVRSALVAALIDSELGGDAEMLRARIATAASGWESALAADLKGWAKSEQLAEISAARRVLQRVLQLLLHGLESRKAG